jgi:hypothetical protein
MRTKHRWVNVSLLSLVLVAGGGVANLSAQAYHRGYQAYPAAYTDLRGLVDRTQTDLRAAADLEHGKDDQRERYRKAQGHLSTFDRKLVHGKFDKGELGKAIDNIKEILDKNVLQPSSRDALMSDLTDLKVARDRRE